MKIQNLSQLQKLFKQAKGRKVKITYVYDFGSEFRMFKHLDSAVAYLCASIGADIHRLETITFENLWADIQK